MPKLSTPSSTLSNGPSAHSNVTSACVQLHLRVQQLLNTTPKSVLSSVLSLSSVQSIIDSFNGMREVLEAIAEAVNSLPSVYAVEFPRLHMAVSCEPVSPTNDADIQACTDHWGWGLHVPCPLQSCLW